MFEDYQDTDEKLERNKAAFYIGHQFAHAAKEDLTAYRVSNAIYSLQLEFQWRPSKRLPLPARDRDWLLEEVAAATPATVRLFDIKRDADRASRGMQAVAGLIILWGQTEEEASLRHPHVYPDMKDHARWLRNACHNVSILDEIEDRASQRIQRSLAKLKTSVGAGQ